MKNQNDDPRDCDQEQPPRPKTRFKIQLTEIDSGIVYEAITEELSFVQNYAAPPANLPIDLMVKVVPKVVSTSIAFNGHFRIMPTISTPRKARNAFEGRDR